jgi:hypothetical protein
MTTHPEYTPAKRTLRPAPAPAKAPPSQAPKPVNPPAEVGKQRPAP